MTTNEELWKTALGEIELSVSKAQFVTWFRDTSILSIEDKRVLISVPNGFTKEWLENKFNTYIIQALQSANQDVNKVSCVLSGPQEKQISSVKNVDAVKAPSFQQNKANLNHATINHNPQNNAYIKEINNINPRYSFENFVVGENNELAQAACFAVSQDLGTNYNPLFIYGGVGLGKTHLLQSIGNKILENNSNKVIRYISAERFTTELVNAIQSKKVESFKNKYQEVDLLIIDDIQFISGKEKTQDIFFHIFNFLYQLNKQIVISSDRPPKNIKILEERLRSRFEGGMITDIGIPDLETRMAILRTKAEEKNFFIEEDVIKYIAENIKNNVRELEGALNKIIATCELSKKNPDLANIKQILGEIISSGKKKGVNHKHIIQAVMDFYDLKEDEILGKSRKKKIALPRQISMYLMREDLNSSYPWIGECFGGRDHTTALHAFEKIKRQLDEDDQLLEDIKFLRDKIYSL